MSGKKRVEAMLKSMEPNRLFFAGKLYQERFADEMTETAYYKALERLRKDGMLEQAARGIYYVPRRGKFGALPPSESDVIEAFIGNETGAVIGYALYNSMKLTTQVGKQTVVLTSALEQQTKRIGNVSLARCPLRFSPKIRRMVEMLDILQHYSKIQGVDPAQFLICCRQFASEYDDMTFAQVQEVLRCPKATISFLKQILDSYHVPNSLQRYLSALSEYKHPRMDELYEAARTS